MAKGTSKSTQAIERLLQERRQYEAWLARIDAAPDATPEHVRVRVRADYAARLAAVSEELTTHAEAARHLVAQKREALAALAKKEQQATERLAETELRYSVGEYDEAQWSQVHEDAMAHLAAVREERQATEADIEKLKELDRLVRAKPSPAPSRPRAPEVKKVEVDELAFLKSVTDGERLSASPRAAQFKPAPAEDDGTLPPAESILTPGNDGTADAPKTLKCAECGSMNGTTEWYCAQCGAELAAL